MKDIQSGKLSKVSAVPGDPNKWALSMYDRSSGMAITPEGNMCQSREQQWQGVRATKGVVNRGKYYYEATVNDEGLCRIGWSLNEASLDLGTDRYGYGFGGTGKKSNNKQFDDYGRSFGLKDVIGCLLDLDRFTVGYSLNGEMLGLAFQIPPQFMNKPFFPAVALKNAEIQLNFGDTPFKFSPPQGFVGLSKASSDCTVKNMNGTGGSSGITKLVPNAPQALILEPSRELAEQTLKEINNFKKYLGAPVVRTMLACGGVPVRDQIADLERGVDIVVGTPGRLEELVKSENLLLSHCRFLVLDEADGLLQQGHGELINRLHGRTPKITPDGKHLQMIVCSATLHNFDVKKMADRLMHFPTWVDLKGEDAVPETVHHVVVLVDPVADKSWQTLRQHIRTDGVHERDRLVPNSTNPETLSEAVKFLKGEYCVRAIREHRMEQD
nr:EOG090X03NS [Cyclestheria hislopi]